MTHNQRLISTQYTMIHQQCMTFVCFFGDSFTDSIPWDSSPLNHHLMGIYFTFFTDHLTSKSKVIAKEIIDGDGFFILQITMGNHSGQEDFCCTSNFISSFGKSSTMQELPVHQESSKTFQSFFHTSKDTQHNGCRGLIPPSSIIDIQYFQETSASSPLSHPNKNHWFPHLSHNYSHLIAFFGAPPFFDSCEAPFPKQKTTHHDHHRKPPCGAAPSLMRRKPRRRNWPRPRCCREDVGDLEVVAAFAMDAASLRLESHGKFWMVDG